MHKTQIWVEFQAKISQMLLMLSQLIELHGMPCRGCLLLPFCCICHCHPMLPSVLIVACFTPPSFTACAITAPSYSCQHCLHWCFFVSLSSYLAVPCCCMTNADEPPLLLLVDCCLLLYFCKSVKVLSCLHCCFLLFLLTGLHSKCSQHCATVLPLCCQC